jgi:ferrous iron transport protein B
MSDSDARDAKDAGSPRDAREVTAREPRPLVALAGNPNAGKTTLFNVLTGSRARVGNYPGVTVDKRVGELKLPGGGLADVLDIPGTYSLIARTGEEEIAIRAMLGLAGEARPNVVVICVDATQVPRGTYIALQALELGLPVVVALTMMDEANESAPDATELARRLGCPVVPVVAPKGKGVRELAEAIERRQSGGEAREIWHWTPSPELRSRLAALVQKLPEGWPRRDGMALWALMSLDAGDELRAVPASLREAVRLAPEAALKIDDEAICGRYAWLDREVAPLQRVPPDRRRSDRVDRVLIHPVAGLGIFLGIMLVIFQSLFAWAEPAMDLVEGIFGWTGGALKGALGEGLLGDFLADGVIAGVGAVVVFLPQILLLFFLLGLLEDSGYMARVAYLMDRIMRAMNLHGRAFVPMLSGFACAVPAIMATRTMERRRDRLLTMMVIPLTTCSARLPVYTLLIASLFPAKKLLGILPAQGLLMVFMYAFGIVTALVAAWILSRTIRPLRGQRLPFVIELPPYRLPRLRDVLHMMWDRSKRFLTEAGTVIVACSVVLWSLLAFPREPAQPSRDWDAALAAAATPDARKELEQARESERVGQSYAGRVGRAIEPALAPLGFDWKMGIGLIGAFAAREVFVATLGVVYGVGSDVDEASDSLRDKIRAERRPDGRPVYTPLVGISLMLFFALSCQCMSTLAVVRRESGGWLWPGFLFAYMTVLAWLVAFAAYQGGRLIGLS